MKRSLDPLPLPVSSISMNANCVASLKTAREYHSGSCVRAAPTSRFCYYDELLGDI